MVVHPAGQAPALRVTYVNRNRTAASYLCQSDSKSVHPGARNGYLHDPSFQIQRSYLTLAFTAFVHGQVTGSVGHSPQPGVNSKLNGAHMGFLFCSWSRATSRPAQPSASHTEPPSPTHSTEWRRRFRRRNIGTRRKRRAERVISIESPGASPFVRQLHFKRSEVTARAHLYNSCGSTSLPGWDVTEGDRMKATAHRPLTSPKHQYHPCPIR